jgi:ferrous iron transport protein A
MESTTKLARLSDLQVGETAEIQEIHLEGWARRRLLDMGFLPGTPIEAVLSSPLGDPKAYKVRGSVIALRFEDANQIFIKPKEQS